jgi:hypothetical protein
MGAKVNKKTDENAKTYKIIRRNLRTSIFLFKFAHIKIGI